MKVYLVYYQDYEYVKIRGIFSSKEKAELVNAKYNLHSDVIEFNLDEIELLSDGGDPRNNRLLDPSEDNSFYDEYGKRTKIIV